jgi:hypothetical protein
MKPFTTILQGQRISSVTFEKGKGCVYFIKKKYCANKRFSVTSNLRYMYGVINVDEIKN